MITQYPFRKIRKAQSKTDFETWGGCEIANTLNTNDISDVYATNIVVEEVDDEVFRISKKRNNTKG